MNKTSDILKLQQHVVDFRNKRDWKQYHGPKESAIALVLEAVELLELFQWNNEKEVKEYLQSPRFQEVKEEVVDVLYWALLIAFDLKIDINKEFVNKMKKNNKNYPVKRAKGKHIKYTEY